MPVVCFMNQKGGVGKTSTCYHLAGALSADGRRVLLVDNDPQASLSQGFLGPDLVRFLDPDATVAALYRLRSPDAFEVVRPSGVAGVDLVPGSRHVNEFNNPSPHEADRDHQNALGEFLRRVAGGYDLVLIDCPPSRGLCTWAALLASDAVVVPLKPEDYGAQSIFDVLRSIERVRAHNSRLVLLGYLLTIVSPRLSVHKLHEKRLRALHRGDVFRTIIPAAADFKQAIGFRLPVQSYKPGSAAARVIRDLAAEIDERLALLVPGREVA